MRSVLTAKVLEIKIKNGYTCESLANELHVSQEELDWQIRQVYPNANVFNKKMKALEANAKIARRTSKAKANKVVKTVAVPEQSAISSVWISENEDTAEPFNLIDSITEEVATVDSIVEQIVYAPKASFIKEMDKATEELNALELQHENYRKDKAQKLESLKEFQLQLTKLQQQCLEIRDNVTSTVTAIDKCTHEMHLLNDTISAKRDIVTKMKEEIAQKPNVAIFVYNNGEIAIQDKKITVFPEWREIHQKMYGSDWADDLTGAQLKQLAKLVAVAQKLKESDAQMDIIFDSEEVEIAFHAMES